MARDLMPVLQLGAAFLAVIAGALWFARPFQAVAPPVEADPTDPTQAGYLVAGVIGFVVLAIGMAALVLWAVKTGRQKIIQGMVLGAVAVALLVALTRPLSLLSRYIGTDPAWLLGLGISIAAAAALFRRPDWRLMNAVGLVIAAAVAGLVGAVIGVLPLTLLLAAIAVYDHFAVRRTKHMQKLARAAVDMRLPIALSIGGPPNVRPAKPARKRTPPEASATTPPAPPRPAPSASIQGPQATLDATVEFTVASPPAQARPAAKPADKAARRRKGTGLFMGVGDLVFPAALIVAAADPAKAWGAWPPVLAVVGLAVGFVLLMRAAWAGKAQPGLPLLNGGTIVGMLVGVLVATQSLVLW